MAKTAFMERAAGRFLVDGVVEPPYPIPYLRELVRSSAHLRPNIDAMVHNVAGHGHGFVQIFDPDGDDAAERVAAILDYEAWRRTEAAGGDEAIGDVPPVTKAQVSEVLDRLRIRQRRERVLLDHWFATATPPPVTFMGLQKERQEEMEWYGFAFWEVVRDAPVGGAKFGRPAWFQRVPADQTRILRGRGGKVDATYVVRRTVLTSEVVTIRRSFCRYVQQSGGDKVYFKEFGDPRLMSRESGRYASESPDGKLPPGENPATELVHWKISDPSSDYGSPRWMSSYLSVLGSRRADEVNAEFFANSAIPPLAVLVESGRLTRQSAQSIRSLFKERKDRGMHAFWEILVLECMANDEFATEGSGKANIKIESLMKDLAGAADRYAGYDKANADKVAGAFRLGRVLRGIGDGVNRATAMALLMIAESQVFAPARNDFDAFMTDFILPAIGVTSWKFVSNGPKMTDPVEIAKVALEAFEADAMTREEYRDVLKALGMPIGYGMETEDAGEGQEDDGVPSQEEQDEDAIEGENEPSEED